MANYKQDIWRLQAQGSPETECTGNHRFYVRYANKKWDSGKRKYEVIYNNSKKVSRPEGPDSEQTWTKTKMKLTRKNDGQDYYFTASGRITSDNADMFSDIMMDACDQPRKIRLNLSDLEYMSSAGLRVLLSVFKKKGAEDFEICGISDYLKETLEMTGYDQILNILTEDQDYGE